MVKRTSSWTLTQSGELCQRVTNMVANLALHVAGIAVVLRLLLISLLARRLDHQLAAYSAGPA